MKAEILLFDIGNTSVKIGLADRRQVKTSYTLPTVAAETADSLGLRLWQLLRHAGVAPETIEGSAVSSVVPEFDPLLRDALARYVGCPVYHVGADLPVPLENRYATPAEVGADRLVGAYAARRLYPAAPSLLVADFGTALTIDCVDGSAYLGGVIFPGPATALSALARNAAKLPRVSLDVQAEELAPCRDTATSIRHGLVFGFACLVEGLTQRLARRLSGQPLVLGTGGFAATIAAISPVFAQVRPLLLLDGLRLLYYETKPAREGQKENTP